MDYTDINNCVQILNEKSKWFFQKDNIAEKLQCLDTIQNIGRPITIYSVVGLLKSNNSLIQEKAAETILHLFGKLRSQNEYIEALKHLDIEKGDLDFYRADFEEKTYVQLLGIASLNSSGYVREKAVNELIRLKNPEGIKYILIRLSDWVAPVRKAAEEGIMSFLEIAYIDELLKLLPFIDWLLDVKRTDLTEIHNRIVRFIVSQEFSNDFVNKIKSLEDKIRFRFYRNFFKQINPNEGQINKIATDSNFLIRLEVLNHLSVFDAGFQKELITNFLQDKSTKIKVKALYASKPYDPYFDDIINHLLSDESASVRELSRFLLRIKVVDFIKLYRERISRNQFLPGSLIGLSEVGTIEDLPIFEKYIISSKSKIVVGCLAAVNKLDPEKATGYSLELLVNPVKKVRNKAIEILAKNSDSAVLKKAREIYGASDFEIKKTILKLYNKIGGWNIVADLLIALADENDNIQNLGWQLLEKWKLQAIRLFTTPPKIEIERANKIYDDLDATKLRMNHSRANLLKDLKFYLG